MGHGWAFSTVGCNICPCHHFVIQARSLRCVAMALLTGSSDLLLSTLTRDIACQ